MGVKLISVFCTALILFGCNGPANSPHNNSSGSSSSSSSSNSSSSSGTVQPARAPLNDTGITLCKTTEEFVACAKTPGQDAALGRDAIAAVGLLAKTGGGVAGFDFTKLDITGRPLAVQTKNWNNSGSENSADQWSCLRDNHTGLIWEMKHHDPGKINYAQHRYTWRNTNSAENGGTAGELGEQGCGPSRCDSESYINALNQAGLCGINHWRMPTILELMSIVNGARTKLAFDVDYFPNGISAEYWTANSFAPDQEFAWYIYMSDGSLSSEHKYSKFLLRLVADKAPGASQ